MTEEVTRVRTLTYERYVHEYALPRRPVIVTDEVPRWAAYGKRSCAELRSRFGERRVPVSLPDGRMGRMRLDQAIDCIVSPAEYTTRDGADASRLHVRDWVVDAGDVDLAEGLGRMPLVSDDLLEGVADAPRLRWFYMGGRGSGSAFHQDTMGTHAWLALLEGTKAWEFVHEAEDVDDAARKTPDFRCELRAGEAIFVPSLVWHRVTNRDLTLAYTANYADVTNVAAVVAQSASDGYADVGERLAGVAGATTVERVLR